MEKEFFECLKRIGNEASNNDVSMTVNVSEPVIMMPAGVSCTGVFSIKREPWYPRPTLHLTLYDRDLQTIYETLIHEYCHMLQWIDSKVGHCDVFKRYFNLLTEDEIVELQEHWLHDYPITEPWDVIGLWLDNKIDMDNFVKSCVQAAQDVEADCERRTLKKIREWDLAYIDQVEYAKRANSYLYFYSYMLKTGFWYSSGGRKPPYMYEKILAAMPSQISDDTEYYHSIPADIEEVYDSIYLSNTAHTSLPKG